MPPRIEITKEHLSYSNRIAPDVSPQIYRIDERTVAKTGDVVCMAEAAAMRFVREKTSIPVPEVFDAFVRPDTNHVCILMEYVEGETLDKAWPSCDDAQKASVISQLRRYTDELRAIPGTIVGSVDGTHCNDQFFSDRDNPTSYGPYDSEDAFTDGLVRSLRERRQNSWIEMVCRFIKALPQHKIVLTHNDLAPRNILVRDAKVVAFLDWELAGFYPEHWEYAKALFWPEWKSSWVADGIVDKILHPYITELACLLHARDIIW